MNIYDRISLCFKRFGCFVMGGFSNNRTKLQMYSMSYFCLANMAQEPRGQGPYGPGNRDQAWDPKRAHGLAQDPDRALFGPQAWSLAPGFPGPYGPWPLGSRPIFARQKHAPNSAYLHPTPLTCTQPRIHAPNHLIDMHPIPYTCTQPSYRHAPNSAYMHPTVL